MHAPTPVLKHSNAWHPTVSRRSGSWQYDPRIADHEGDLVVIGMLQPELHVRAQAEPESFHRILNRFARSRLQLA
jgi:hypothetical protein